MRSFLAASALAWLLLATAVASGAGNPVSAMASPTALPLAGAAWRSDGQVALAVGGVPGEGVVVRVAGDQAVIAGADDHRWLAVAWSPSAGPALVAGDGGVLRTQDGADFDRLAVPTGLDSFAGRTVAWKPDGSEALIAGSALLRYVAADGRLEVVRASADEAFGAAAWAPDGTYALVEQARRDGTAWTTGRLMRYDGAGLTHVATFGQGDALVTGIAFARDGWAIVVGTDPASGRGPAMRWTGAALEPWFVKAAGTFTSAAWRPGGASMLLTGAGGEALATTTATGYAAVDAPPTDLLAAAWDPSGERALIVGAGGYLGIWRPDGVPIVQIRAPFEGAVLRDRGDLVVHAEPRQGHDLLAVEARVDDLPWQRMAPLPTGDYGLPLGLEGLPDGLHLLSARARDDLGAGPLARAQVRVFHGILPAPAFVSLPTTDEDGVLAVHWTDLGADRYDLEITTANPAGDRVTVQASRDSGATVALPAPGTHTLRVRGWIGDSASPWSPAATVAWVPAPPASGGPAPAGDASPHDGASKATPGLPLLLLLGAGAVVAIAARRR